jgi:anti-sigma factor RsiW
MTCGETLIFLDAYMDGELGVEPNLVVERHLEVCSICPAELASRPALSSAMQARFPRPRSRCSVQYATSLRVPTSNPAKLALMRRAPPAWVRLAASFVLVAGLKLRAHLLCDPDKQQRDPRRDIRESRAQYAVGHP